MIGKIFVAKFYCLNIEGDFGRFIIASYVLLEHSCHNASKILLMIKAAGLLLSL